MQQLLEETRDILMDWLDAQFGSSVMENSIFADLPRHYEAEYHEDMDALNVRINRSFIPWYLVTQDSLSSVASKFSTKVALWCVHADWLSSPTPNWVEAFTLTSFAMTIALYGLLLDSDSVSVNELLGQFYNMSPCNFKRLFADSFLSKFTKLPGRFSKKKQVLQFSELSYHSFYHIWFYLISIFILGRYCRLMFWLGLVSTFPRWWNTYRKSSTMDTRKWRDKTNTITSIASMGVCVCIM